MRLGLFAMALILCTSLLGVIVERSNAINQPSLIRIFSVETRRLTEGRQPGDRYISFSILKDRRARIIGHSSLKCTRSFLKMSSCEATYILPRGKIVTQGTMHSRRYFVLAVVGGTGFYSGVGGTMDSLAIDNFRTHRLLFSLKP